jgi:hypothetical protein
MPVSQPQGNLLKAALMSSSVDLPVTRRGGSVGGRGTHPESCAHRGIHNGR